MNEFHEQFAAHTARDEKIFSDLAVEIRLIKENHLAHIEKSMGSLDGNFKEAMLMIKGLHSKLDGNTIETVKNTANIGWLMWGFMAFMGALITGVVALMFTIGAKG